eukprot:5067598-Lingulodinium_polyedra.AAC.1
MRRAITLTGTWSRNDCKEPWPLGWREARQPPAPGPLCRQSRTATRSSAAPSRRTWRRSLG